MSEKDLNSYRFLSGEEPTDEMLAAIMKEVVEEAVARQRIADEQMKKVMVARREFLHKKYDDRINRILNG